MQKDYETFVEKLEIGIYEATGIPRENISFEEEGGRFAPVGDRLLVKFAEHDDAWEVCGLYTQELFKSYQNVPLNIGVLSDSFQLSPYWNNMYACIHEA